MDKDGTVCVCHRNLNLTSSAGYKNNNRVTFVSATCCNDFQSICIVERKFVSFFIFFFFTINLVPLSSQGNSFRFYKNMEMFCTADNFLLFKMINMNRCYLSQSQVNNKTLEILCSIRRPYSAYIAVTI